MKKEKARAEVINRWMEKAHEALKSAKSEQNSDMTDLINKTIKMEA